MIKSIKNHIVFGFVKNVATSKIRSMAVGLVELNGKVKTYSKEGLLVSPVNKKKCVHYEVRIDRRKRRFLKFGFG